MNQGNFMQSALNISDDLKEKNDITLYDSCKVRRQSESMDKVLIFLEQLLDLQLMCKLYASLLKCLKHSFTKFILFKNISENHDSR